MDYKTLTLEEAKNILNKYIGKKLIRKWFKTKPELWKNHPVKYFIATGKIFDKGETGNNDNVTFEVNIFSENDEYIGNYPSTFDFLEIPGTNEILGEDFEIILDDEE